MWTERPELVHGSVPPEDSTSMHVGPISPPAISFSEAVRNHRRIDPPSSRACPSLHGRNHRQRRHRPLSASLLSSRAGCRWWVCAAVGSFYSFLSLVLGGGGGERERWVDSSVVLDLGMGGRGCRPRVGVGRTNAGTGASEGLSGASRRGVGRRLAWTVVSFICTIYFMYYLLSIQSAESLHNCSTPLHIHSALSHQRRRILSEAQIAPLGRRRLHPRRSSFPRPRIISKRPRHSSSTWLGRSPLSLPPAMPALSRCRRQRDH